MLSVRITKDPIIVDDDSFRAYLSRIRKYKPVSREEEVELLLRAKEGDEKAIDKLLKANLRFVVSVAKKFAANNPVANINDLISAGNLGLYEAIINFKQEKIGKCKLISYAIFHIAKRIREELHSNFSVFKINDHNKNLIVKVINLMKYDSKLTYEDAITIVLKEQKISDKKKKDLTLAIQTLNAIPLSEVLSYEKELDEYKYEDLTYDEKEFQRVLDEEAIRSFVHEVINACTKVYPHKKVCFEVVKLRLGISTKHPMTTKEISTLLGINVDKVWNYYKEGIRKIRSFILKHRSIAAEAANLLNDA